MDNFFKDSYDDKDFTLFLQSINSSRERIKRIYYDNKHIAPYVLNLYHKFKQTIYALEQKEINKKKLINKITLLCKNNGMKKELLEEWKGKDNENDEFIKELKEICNIKEKDPQAQNKQTQTQSQIALVGGENLQVGIEELKNTNNLFSGKKNEQTENTSSLARARELVYNNEISSFKYTMEDKYIFIGVTFVIRAISLVILKWAIDVDFVTIFESAIYLYIAIYILLFCMIWAIINYSGMETDKLPYYLYSFNRINGNTHLIVHIALMLILSIIPFIIQAGKDDLSFSKHFSESMEGKRDIYRGLSNFTLLSWISLSLIALI